MARSTALYRDPRPPPAARAVVELERNALGLRMPDGRMRWHALDGTVALTADAAYQRRFVRMLILERAGERSVVITPPDQGAVAPGVVRVPEAPEGAAIVDGQDWEALVDWLMSGGRLTACSVAELARLAAISTPQFAVVIGEVAAQRALDLLWSAAGPLRGGLDLHAALQPLSAAARRSPRAAEALVAALAHAAGVVRRRR
jgi:hypothetical protein